MSVQPFAVADIIATHGACSRVNFLDMPAASLTSDRVFVAIRIEQRMAVCTRKPLCFIIFFSPISHFNDFHIHILPQCLNLRCCCVKQFFERNVTSAFVEPHQITVSRINKISYPHCYHHWISCYTP